MSDSFTFHHTGHQARQRVLAAVAMLAILLVGPLVAARAIQGSDLVAQMMRVPVVAAVVGVVVVGAVLVRRSRLSLRVDLSPVSLTLDGERVVVAWTDLAAVWVETTGPRTYLYALPRDGVTLPRSRSTFPTTDPLSGHVVLAPLDDLDVHVAQALTAVHECAGDLLVDAPPTDATPAVRTTFDRRVGYRLVPAIAAGVVGWYLLTFLLTVRRDGDASATVTGAELVVGGVVVVSFAILTVRSLLRQRLELTPDELRITAFGHTNAITWTDLEQLGPRSARGAVVEVVGRPRQGSPRPAGLRGFGFPKWRRERGELALFPTAGWDGRPREILAALPVFAGERWVEEPLDDDPPA